MREGRPCGRLGDHEPHDWQLPRRPYEHTAGEYRCSGRRVVEGGHG